MGLPCEDSLGHSRLPKVKPGSRSSPQKSLVGSCLTYPRGQRRDPWVSTLRMGLYLGEKASHQSDTMRQPACSWELALVGADRGQGAIVLVLWGEKTCAKSQAGHMESLKVLSASPESRGGGEWEVLQGPSVNVVAMGRGVVGQSWWPIDDSLGAHQGPWASCEPSFLRRCSRRHVGMQSFGSAAILGGDAVTQSSTLQF